MLDEKRVVTLNDYEQRLMVRGLTDFRNDAPGRQTHRGCGRSHSQSYRRAHKTGETEV